MRAAGHALTPGLMSPSSQRSQAIPSRRSKPRSISRYNRKKNHSCGNLIFSSSSVIYGFTCLLHLVTEDEVTAGKGPQRRYVTGLRNESTPPRAMIRRQPAKRLAQQAHRARSFHPYGLPPPRAFACSMATPDHREATGPASNESRSAPINICAPHKPTPKCPARKIRCVRLRLALRLHLSTHMPGCIPKARPDARSVRFRSENARARRREQ